jgi:hypothetical protein
VKKRTNASPRSFFIIFQEMDECVYKLSFDCLRSQRSHIHIEASFLELESSLALAQQFSIYCLKTPILCKISYLGIFEIKEKPSNASRRSFLLVFCILISSW